MQALISRLALVLNISAKYLGGIPYPRRILLTLAVEIMSPFVISFMGLHQRKKSFKLNLLFSIHNFVFVNKLKISPLKN